MKVFVPLIFDVLIVNISMFIKNKGQRSSLRNKTRMRDKNVATFEVSVKFYIRHRLRGYFTTPWTIVFKPVVQRKAEKGFQISVMPPSTKYICMLFHLRIF